MTAKEEILALMEQIPDDLTVAETIAHLQSANAENGGAETVGKGSSPTMKRTPPHSAPPPLDSEAVKEEIVAIMTRLPNDLTAAEAACEAADSLRHLYLVEKDFEDIREGRALPLEERDYRPEFHEELPELGSISSAEFDQMTMKEKLVHTMKLLPGDLSLGQAVYEALERLLLMYNLEKAFEQIRRGEVIPHEEVMRRFQKEWDE